MRNGIVDRRHPQRTIIECTRIYYNYVTVCVRMNAAMSSRATSAKTCFRFRQRSFLIYFSQTQSIHFSTNVHTCVCVFNRRWKHDPFLCEFELERNASNKNTNGSGKGNEGREKYSESFPYREYDVGCDVCSQLAHIETQRKNRVFTYTSIFIFITLDDGFSFGVPIFFILITAT